MLDTDEFKEQIRFFGWGKAIYSFWRSLPSYRVFWKLISFGQNLWTYLPIIWRDGDFDFNFLLALMEFKLSQMSKHMLEHNIVLDAPKISKELKIASTLCKRIREDNYYDIPLEILEREYGKWEVKTRSTDNPNLNTVILDRSGAREGTVEYDVVKAKERKIFDNARAQRERDKEYLFDLMKKKIDHWWC